MDDAERFETALRVVQSNLVGREPFDFLKPLSASSANSLAKYIEFILDGATPQEAAEKMNNG